MCKFLEKLKQIFVDNKLVIICNILLVAGTILAFAIGFAVPASAEASTTIIEAGTYRWNDTITSPTIGNIEVPIPCYVTPVTINVELDGVVYPLTCGGQYEHINAYTNGDILYGWSDTHQQCYSLSDGWNYVYNQFYDGGSGIAFPELLGFGQVFTISEDISLSDFYAPWFLANAQPVSSDTTENIIEAGFYKVRDSWNTSGWPVTNDSIEFRYYDELDQSYIEAEGIAFLIENRDMVSIWYMDNNVYLDGWNIEGANFIEVTQDIAVEPEFYTVFNNVYETSSQGLNEFESGYAAGYNDGFSAGRDVGYNQGYYEGMSESSGNFFTDILGGVLGSLDSFTLFGGYSLLDLITTLLGGFALIWILKLLAGG